MTFAMSELNGTKLVIEEEVEYNSNIYNCNCFVQSLPPGRWGGSNNDS